MTSETYLRLRAFARMDGARLGLLWVVSFALFVGSFYSSVFSILWMGTMIATPFYVGLRTKTYSEQTETGHISYGHAYAHSSLTIFYASLILAIVQWAYFQFIDNGFVINQYIAIFTDKENVQMMTSLGYTKEMLNNMIENMRSLRPIDMSLQMLWANVVAGLIISLTTALYVSFRH